MGAWKSLIIGHGLPLINETIAFHQSIKIIQIKVIEYKEHLLWESLMCKSFSLAVAQVKNVTQFKGYKIL